MSVMTTVVELTCPAERLGFAQTFDRMASFEFHFDGMIGRGPPLVWVSGPDRGTVTAALEADPTVRTVTNVVDGSDGRWLYRLSFGRRYKLFQQIVANNEGAMIGVTGADGKWALRLLFHDRELISDAYGLFEQYDFGASVTRLSPMDETVGQGAPLTETQYETIAVAYERGYFDVPRQLTLEELADELDVSHQALSERLRRSQAALVSSELSTRSPPIGPRS